MLNHIIQLLHIICSLLFSSKYFLTSSYVLSWLRIFWSGVHNFQTDSQFSNYICGFPPRFANKIISVLNNKNFWDIDFLYLRIRSVFIYVPGPPVKNTYSAVDVYSIYYFLFYSVTEENGIIFKERMTWYIRLRVLKLWRRRHWRPTPVPLPGKSHWWRSLVGCSPWGH